MPFYQHELPLNVDECNEHLMFIWPTLLIHKIDSKSPFFGLKAGDNFEVIVILEGAVETTGLQTQARTSYTSNEILWNHRFESMINISSDSGAIEVCSSLLWSIFYSKLNFFNRLTTISLMPFNHVYLIIHKQSF